MANGVCDKCKQYSYELEEYKGQYFCEICLYELGQDYEWVKDYNNALTMLNKELIVVKTELILSRLRLR